MKAYTLIVTLLALTATLRVSAEFQPLKSDYKLRAYGQPLIYGLGPLEFPDFILRNEGIQQDRDGRDYPMFSVLDRQTNAVLKTFILHNTGGLTLGYELIDINSTRYVIIYEPAADYDLGLTDFEIVVWDEASARLKADEIHFQYFAILH